ncbi:LysM peptidoglycan-binding domain-containing protein [Acinetobacter brisouii]|uniref:LysM peptidoglycan-binding domain-containing protein n=1 Tax=Acinetobacter brisouii TaxID=396323 RepID=UPI0005F84E43|nr:LysM peptidoglycan-binding domain-containing protein [Acinetobacter brisouii]KJV36382.1 peptidoglycan-binding protein LysM [Acinetobacter brisouii]
MNKKGFIQFRFVELFTGNNIPNLYHVIKNEKGTTIASGSTDGNGLTVLISRDVGDTLYVYIKNLITGELKEKVRHTIIYKKEIVRVTSSKILLDNIVLTKSTNTAGAYRYLTHKVRSGDNLTSIAHKYNTNVNTIVKMNKLSDPDHISIGQVIKVPYTSTVSKTSEDLSSNTTSQTKTNSSTEVKKTNHKNTDKKEVIKSSKKNSASNNKPVQQSTKRIESKTISDEHTKETGKPMKVAQNATSPCICKQYNLVWGDKVNCAFRKKIIEICKIMWPDNTKIMANNLMACIHLESAKSFSPQIENGSGYVGLIQFGPDVIKDLRAHTDNTLTKTKLKKMTAVQQLDLVKAHFMRGDHHKLMKNLTDMYLYINYPRNLLQGRNKPNDVLYEGGGAKSAYHANPSFMKEKGEYDNIYDYKKNADGTYKLDKHGEKIPIRGFSNGKTYVWEVAEELLKHLPKEQLNKTNSFACAYENLNSKKMVNTKINLDKFAETLKRRAGNTSQQKCATFVRLALEAAGANTQGHPIAASDWGPTLLKNGYKEISQNFDNPLKGDIYIIQKTKIHTWGHIAGYTGDQWISDFKQKSHVIYRDHVTYTYYRIY